MENEAVERVRLTISVTPEVHAVFQRLAGASGMSLSRAMGEWLGDTLEAVEFTASKVEQARAAPKLAMREMHAYALGLSDETGQLLSSMKAGGAGPRVLGRAASEVTRAGSPPSSNTGGKGTNKRSKR